MPKITRPGLEQLPSSTGEKAFFKKPGPTSGPIGPDFNSADDIRRQVVADLNHCLNSFKRLQETVDTEVGRNALSDDMRNLTSILQKVEAMPLVVAYGGR